MPPKKPAAKKPAGAAAKTPKPAAKAGAGAKGAAAESTSQPEVKVDEGFTITIKQLNPVVCMEEPRLQQSGKYPLMLDGTGLVSTFLRHRDCNYLDALDKEHMEPERIRKALIGAIRFGKPLVVDLMETDMFAHVTEQFDAIKPKLMDAILSKEIIKNEKYLELVTEEDGDLYHDYLFEQKCLDSFCFLVISRLEALPSVGHRMYPVTVQQN